MLAEIASRESLSANSLEGWIECSYRWFVSHELSPQRLEPVADPLWLGGVLHRALHDLYSAPPGDDSIPRPDDIGVWIARFNEILDGLLGQEDSGYHGPDRRLSIARARVQVERFLEEESERETDLRPRPDLLERSFGFPDAENDPGALDLGDFTLRGFVDRIDVAPDSTYALVRDYKTSKKVPGRAKIAEEGKLQLPLYMLVARDLLNLEPVAGLYHPLAAYGDRRGRGIAVTEEHKGGVLSGEQLVGTDTIPARSSTRPSRRQGRPRSSTAPRCAPGGSGGTPSATSARATASTSRSAGLSVRLGIEEESQGGDDK